MHAAARTRLHTALTLLPPTHPPAPFPISDLSLRTVKAKTPLGAASGRSGLSNALGNEENPPKVLAAPKRSLGVFGW